MDTLYRDTVKCISDVGSWKEVDEASWEILLHWRTEETPRLKLSNVRSWPFSCWKTINWRVLSTHPFYCFFLLSKNCPFLQYYYRLNNAILWYCEKSYQNQCKKNAKKQTIIDNWLFQVYRVALVEPLWAYLWVSRDRRQRGHWRTRCRQMEEKGSDKDNSRICAGSFRTQSSRRWLTRKICIGPTSFGTHSILKSNFFLLMLLWREYIQPDIWHLPALQPPEFHPLL